METKDYYTILLAILKINKTYSRKDLEYFYEYFCYPFSPQKINRLRTPGKLK